ncbi:MAG: Mur ligase family protein [Candidatus Absconditicoccaceae bacterium]
MKAKLLNLYYRLLGLLASKYLKKHKTYIIGINGSVGKTSCRMIIAQTLKKFLHGKKIYTSPKNFNGELGLSLSVFEIEKRDPNIFCLVTTLFKSVFKLFFGKRPYDIIILEYGIDRPLEMEFLIQIAKPHIGVFTAIDAVHSEQFGNPAEIAKEEVKMIKNTLEIAFLNQNDMYAMSLKDHIKIDSFIYQTQGDELSADIKIMSSKFNFQDGKIISDIVLDIKGNEYKVQTNLMGKPNYGYIGVSLMILEILNYKYKTDNLKTNDNLELNYKLQPGRFSVFEGVENSIIFDSSYNASPLSVRKIIDSVHNIKSELFPYRKVWMVLGDMRELGDLTEKEHRLLAGYVSQFADKVFLVGKQMCEHLADELDKVGYDKSLIYKFDKSNEAGKIIKNALKEVGDEILFICKGSQNTIFIEETVKMLLKNPEDQKYLTRQSKWWLDKKNRFFTTQK